MRILREKIHAVTKYVDIYVRFLSDTLKKECIKSVGGRQMGKVCFVVIFHATLLSSFVSTSA
jgi:hypothetical protein